tara:strand:- start:33 stop:446 length:414 start_codon:yes stop_codon:yes gene_type:complete
MRAQTSDHRASKVRRLPLASVSSANSMSALELDAACRVLPPEIVLDPSKLRTGMRQVAGSTKPFTNNTNTLLVQNDILKANAALQELHQAVRRTAIQLFCRVRHKYKRINQPHCVAACAVLALRALRWTSSGLCRCV